MRKGKSYPCWWRDMMMMIYLSTYGEKRSGKSVLAGRHDDDDDDDDDDENNDSNTYPEDSYQLYGHLPPITKTIQVRRTRHAGHCWRSRDQLISDVLLWTPTYGRAKAGRPARTCIQQLCEDTGCCPEDLPEAMNDREKWRERVRDIRATSTTWWWGFIKSNVWFSISLTLLD